MIDLLGGSKPSAESPLGSMLNEAVLVVYDLLFVDSDDKLTYQPEVERDLRDAAKLAAGRCGYLFAKTADDVSPLFEIFSLLFGVGGK